MPSVTLTRSLRDEYRRLFDGIMYTAPAVGITSDATRLHENRERYVPCAVDYGVPWLFLGLVHLMESSCQFTVHLHNGDPLKARTVHVPAGRPRKGTPPFLWEYSAADALSLFPYFVGDSDSLSLAHVLYWLECWNGLGYRTRHPEVLSPYLWAGSQHYTSGKYGSDGVWNPRLVSKQIGAAVVMRRYFEVYPLEVPVWAGGGAISPWRYGDEGTAVVALQNSLNAQPGIYLHVDGKAGQRTSDAFKVVMGEYLPGDPREA